MGARWRSLGGQWTPGQAVSVGRSCMDGIKTGDVIFSRADPLWTPLTMM